MLKKENLKEFLWIQDFTLQTSHGVTLRIITVMLIMQILRQKPTQVFVSLQAV